jgi:hypothetical protein
MNLKIIGIVAVFVAIAALIGFVVFGSGIGIIEEGWDDTNDGNTDDETGGTYETQIIVGFEDGSKKTLSDLQGGPLTVSYQDNPITSIGLDINIKVTGTGEAAAAELDIADAFVEWVYVDSSSYIQAYDVNLDGYIDQADADEIIAHHGETGDPQWIRADLNYDGVIDSIDSSLIIDRIGAGAQQGDPVWGSGQIDCFDTASPAGTILIDATGNWNNDFIDATKEITDLDTLAPGTYTVGLTTYVPTHSNTFEYRAVDANNNPMTNADWKTASFPLQKAISVKVTPDGDVTIEFSVGAPDIDYV